MEAMDDEEERVVKDRVLDAEGARFIEFIEELSDLLEQDTKRIKKATRQIGWLSLISSLLVLVAIWSNFSSLFGATVAVAIIVFTILFIKDHLASKKFYKAHCALYKKITEFNEKI